MFTSTQEQVQITAQKLGYTLTQNRVEDIAFKVDSSPLVTRFSKELTLPKIITDVRIFCYCALVAFGIITAVPLMVNRIDPSFNQVTIEDSLRTGVDVFNKTFGILFALELIWVMINLYRENQATQKMILYFLQRKVDVRK
jgi:hypothetical protein